MIEPRASLRLVIVFAYLFCASDGNCSIYYFGSRKIELPLTLPPQMIVLKVVDDVLRYVRSMLGKDNISFAVYPTALDVNGARHKENQ